MRPRGKEMQRCTMIQTLDPDKIPNGSTGTVISKHDILGPGLHHIRFDCGYHAYVYPGEVKASNQALGRDGKGRAG